MSARQRAAVPERRIKALELRKAGQSYRAIGRALGISYQQALRDVTHVLDDLNAQATDTAERYRRLEVERLDALLDPLWPSAIGGHLRAQEMVLRIMERRAKLLGLDAPLQHEVLVRQQAERLAAELGLDPAEVLAEAERIVRAGAG